MSEETASAGMLGSDDFGHILTTFPVFARKRPEFYAYLHSRRPEWSEGVQLASSLK